MNDDGFGIILSVAGFAAILGAIAMALGALGGCNTYIVREAAPYTVEVLTALARQEEAMFALQDAAVVARDRGDYAACVKYATPAVALEAYARPQALRALWLAGLPYPTEDGAIPELQEGEAQPDPGASRPPRDVRTICGEPPAPPSPTPAAPPPN